MTDTFPHLQRVRALQLALPIGSAARITSTDNQQYEGTLVAVTTHTLALQDSTGGVTIRMDIDCIKDWCPGGKITTALTDNTTSLEKTQKPSSTALSPSAIANSDNHDEQPIQGEHPGVIDAEARYNQVKQLERQKRFDEAISLNYRILADVHGAPSEKGTRNNLANLLSRQGRYKEAITVLLSSNEPNESLLADVYYKAGMYNEAMSIWQKRLESSSAENGRKWSDTYIRLAACYMRLERYDKAESILLMAMKVANTPDNKRGIRKKLDECRKNRAQVTQQHTEVSYDPREQPVEGIMQPAQQYSAPALNSVCQCDSFWPLWNKTETKLRKAIQELLRARYGEEWFTIVEKKYPALRVEDGLNLFQRCRARQQDEIQAPWRRLVNPLDFTRNIQELFDVIFAEWEVPLGERSFKTIFGPEQTYWKKTLSTLVKVRNAVAHNRAYLIDANDRKLAEACCNKILDRIMLYNLAT